MRNFDQILPRNPGVYNSHPGVPQFSKQRSISGIVLPHPSSRHYLRFLKKPASVRTVGRYNFTEFDQLVKDRGMVSEFSPYELRIEKE